MPAKIYSKLNTRGLAVRMVLPCGWRYPPAIITHFFRTDYTDQLYQSDSLYHFNDVTLSNNSNALEIGNIRRFTLKDIDFAPAGASVKTTAGGRICGCTLHNCRFND